MIPSPLHIDGRRFVDAKGRHVILRGVNLGGDCKVPFPDGGTQHPSDFADHRSVSFIGRPFPLAQADQHLGRIVHWGFNCLRLLTTWEAVEHAGPRRYDTAYLDYYAEVCRRAGEHGLRVFVDFHQDVWSRMSGGDGAPGWIFDALGIDFTRLHAAGAAHVMQQAYDYASAERHQAAYPSMSWASNYRRPANGIMWTLFWGGRRVTPEFRIEGLNVQDYLQHHLLGAMETLARHVACLGNVIGFDSLNEPGTGWLGQALSPVPLPDGSRVPMPALPGLMWSPLHALAVARGLPTALPRVVPGDDGLVVAGTQLVNPQGLSIWAEGRRCPFEQAGIYRVRGDRVEALDETVFQRGDGGRPVDIAEDAYAPFFHDVAHTVRQHAPQWILFAELDPMATLAGRRFPAAMPASFVNAGHWYDLTLLLAKRFDENAHPDLLGGAPACGAAAIVERYESSLRRLMQSAGEHEVPTLVGECGIPFDLHDGAAYAAWARGERGPAVWHAQARALTLMYDALDRLQLSSTQWNYTATNRNDSRVGDGWNQEDLSIFSVDQHDPEQGADSGGRAVDGFCRPYACAVQGRLLEWRFDAVARTCLLRYQADPRIGAPTEVYLPRRAFGEDCHVKVEVGLARVELDAESQRLKLWAGTPGVVEVTIRSATPA